MKITSIRTETINIDQFNTVIYHTVITYLDCAGTACRDEQKTLLFKKVEKFIRNFRIKHKL